MRVFAFASMMALLPCLWLAAACSSSPGPRPGVDVESPGGGSSGGGGASGEDAGTDSSTSEDAGSDSSTSGD